MLGRDPSVWSAGEAGGLAGSGEHADETPNVEERLTLRTGQVSSQRLS